ncbi:MAG TPA: YceI family protein [Methylomirabilota bacterium]|nr:YceI family protein [Methylomirabilota bacterium]
MKKFRIQVLAVVALALATTVWAQSLVKYESKPGTKVRLDGTSSIKAWDVESGIVAGTLEIDSAFAADPTAAKPGKIPAQVTTTIPVRSLKSGTKAMDDRMYQAMNLQKFPRIEYRLTELTLKETPKSANGPFNFDSKGELSLSGVTNKVSFPVTMTRSDKTLKTSGSASVKMTSYGIEPPGLILGIKTGDEVKVTFEWVTGVSEAK